MASEPTRRASTRRLRALSALALLLLATSPVLASAPPDQYAPFLPSTNEIRDVKTGLLWDRRVQPVADYGAAFAYCTGRGKRMPTSKELATLVDEVGHDEFIDGRLVRLYIDEQAFKGTPPGAFWTFKAVSRPPFVIDFATGELTEGAGVQVRCVL